MYNNYINVFKIALYIIVNVIKEYILIIIIINYLIRAKACNYIENTLFSKVPPKVPTPGNSGLFSNPGNSEHRISLIGPPNPLFWLPNPTKPN